MLTLATALLLAEVSPPLIQCVSTPDYDCETGIYSGVPASELFPNDAAAAVEIYRPYWECHWRHVEADRNFGTNSGATAVTVFQAATAACTDQKNYADAVVDQLLLKQPRYGNDENRHKLREAFRLQGGLVFAYAEAARSGRRTQLSAMADSISALNPDSSNAPDQ